jgi:hypothetical protein
VPTCAPSPALSHAPSARQHDPLIRHPSREVVMYRHHRNFDARVEAMDEGIAQGPTGNPHRCCSTSIPERMRRSTAKGRLAQRRGSRC